MSFCLPYQVERVFAKSHLDLYEIQKAKKLLKVRFEFSSHNHFDVFALFLNTESIPDTGSWAVFNGSTCKTCWEIWWWDWWTFICLFFFWPFWFFFNFIRLVRQHFTFHSGYNLVGNFHSRYNLFGTFHSRCDLFSKHITDNFTHFSA